MRQTTNIRSIRLGWNVAQSLLIICSRYSEYEALKSRSRQSQSPFIILKSRFVCSAPPVSKQMFSRKKNNIFMSLSQSWIVNKIAFLHLFSIMWHGGFFLSKLSASQAQAMFSNSLLVIVAFEFCSLNGILINYYINSHSQCKFETVFIEQ